MPLETARLVGNGGAMSWQSAHGAHQLTPHIVERNQDGPAPYPSSWWKDCYLAAGRPLPIFTLYYQLLYWNLQQQFPSQANKDD